MASPTTSVNYGRFTIKVMKAHDAWQARAFRGDQVASDISGGETAEAAILAVKAALDEAAARERASRGADGYPAAATVRAALARIQISDGQWSMLKAHSAAPDQILTATELAQAAGYKDYQAANLQYGLLGYALAEEMAWTPDAREDGTPVWTYALATDADEDRHQSSQGEGGFRWRLRPQVIEALSA